MSEDLTPTTLRRQLGAELRHLRQSQGMTTRQVAARIGVSESKISRLESGSRGAKTDDLRALAELFEVDPGRVRALQDIAVQGNRRRPATLQPASLETDDVKIEQSGFLDSERDALAIREYNSGVVPGLLQIPQYMRAGMSAASPKIAASVLDKTIEMRRARQSRSLTKQTYGVIVDEAALLREMGGPAVMSLQIAAIQEAMDRGTVLFKVIPFTVGAHSGVNSMFVALTMDHDVPDVVFVEGLAGHVRFEKASEVRRFDRVWRQLGRLTETPRATCRRLEALRRDYASRASKPGVKDDDQAFGPR